MIAGVKSIFTSLEELDLSFGERDNYDFEGHDAVKSESELLKRVFDPTGEKHSPTRVNLFERLKKLRIVSQDNLYDISGDTDGEEYLNAQTDSENLTQDVVAWFVHSSYASLEELRIRTNALQISSGVLGMCLCRTMEPLSILISEAIAEGEWNYKMGLAGECSSVWRVWIPTREDPRTGRERGRWMYSVRDDCLRLNEMYPGEEIEMEAP